MEYEMPVDKERLEKDVDEMFERLDKRYFEFMEKILDEMRKKDEL